MKLDFPGIIQWGVEFAPLPPKADRLKCIILDEAQDTTDAEWHIIKRWARACDADLIPIGDPHQTLYEWRGASRDILLEEPRVVLNQSYRVPTNVWLSARKLLEKNADPELRVPKRQIPGNLIERDSVKTL